MNAPVEGRGRHSSLTPPLGLSYVAAVLIRAGYDVSALDLCLNGFDKHGLRCMLEKGRPRVLGISALTQTYLNALEIARIAKEVDRETVVVIGGPHVTVLYEQALSEKSVDVVVRGEGEYTMLELANHYLNGLGSLSRIRGIAFRDEGATKVTRDRPLACLDQLPYPARGLFPLPLYAFPSSVLFSRGGYPLTCVACATDGMLKLDRRFRDPQRVVEEIIFLLERQQAEEIVFADDSFTLDRRRVLALCHFLTRLAPTFQWQCATRIDLVDDELLEKMRKAGCHSIRYEVEVGGQGKRYSVARKITLKQANEAFRATIDAGIDATFSSVSDAGDVGETVCDHMPSI